MRRFVHGQRFWEIALDGRVVVTRHGVVGKNTREERRFCRSGAENWYAERVAKRLAEGSWVEDRAEPPMIVDQTPGVVGLVGALPFDRVTGPGPRSDAERRVGTDLLRSRETLRRTADGLPVAVGETLRRLVEAAPAIGILDPDGAALLLSVLPGRETADLVIGRSGLDGLVRVVIEGRWLARIGGVWRVGGRTRSEVPSWLLRARALSRSVSDGDLAAAVARARAAASNPRIEAWRLVDLAVLLPEAELGPQVLARYPRSLPKSAAHLAAALDPVGWQQLASRLGVDATSARAETVAPWLPTLVARYGPLALAVEAVRTDLALVRCIRHPDAARELLRAYPDEGNDALLTALVAMAPFTLQVLATDGAKTDATRTLARELAVRPGLAGRVAPLLGPAGKRRLTGWLSSVTPVAEVVPAVLSGAPRRPVPRWLELPKLPALLTPDGISEYPAVARARAIEQMQTCDAGTVAALRAACDRASLGAFVLGLVDQYVVYTAEVRRGREAAAEMERELRREAWDEAHATHPYVWVDFSTPEDEAWVLRAAALWGDGGTARGLAQRVRAWPRVLWQLAAEGVDAIASIDDPAARVELGSLARRGPGVVTKRADLHLRSVGRRRGPGDVSLDGTLLPDLGLDENGSLTLDYGKRRFVVGFDGALAPFVRAEDGTVAARLPRPRKTDDPVLATAASRTWSALRKDARTVKTTLLHHLEDGLRRQRRWPVRDFRSWVAHPFGRHVVTRLLWECDGQLFRIDEEGLPVGADHLPVALSGTVRLPHPIRLGDDDRARWQQVFADYEIVQPLEQLARVCHRPGPDETGPLLGRLAGSNFQHGRLFALRTRGWRWQAPRDPTGEPGPVIALHGDWAGPGLVARLAPVDPNDPEDTSVTIAQVVWGTKRWEDVDPVVFSEVVRDLG